MNKAQIGENAGKLWNFLKDNRHWEYEKLKEASGLSDRDLNAAIGWLAREDKIDFDMTEEAIAYFNCQRIHWLIRETFRQADKGCILSLSRKMQPLLFTANWHQIILLTVISGKSCKNSSNNPSSFIRLALTTMLT